MNNRTVVFVAISFGLHCGMLWLAETAVGRTVLTTPAAMLLVVLWGTQIAWSGPSIYDRTGNLLRAVWRTIGVSISLVAMGLAFAFVIENAHISPTVKSVLFTSWWISYLALTARKSIGYRLDRAAVDGSPQGGVRWWLAILFMPVVVIVVFTVFHVHLAYFGPDI